MWTLQYHDASNTLQEVSFPQLAALEGGQVVADAWQARFTSHKASTVTLQLPGVPPHIAPAIPFESRVSIWSGRALSAGVYSGGTIQFQGLRTDRTGSADAQRATSGYQFDDEWYFLDHCPFQQMWVQLATAGGAAHYVPFSSVVLFQPNPGQTYSPAPVNGLLSTGQQIVDILNWAILMGANLQIGQIDPALYQAFYPVQNVKCGDALRHCLRLHPDCYTEIDYTATPPLFNIRQRSNLTPVTLPYAYTDSTGRRHLASEIQPRPELQPRRVALFYRIIAENFLLATPVDIYPRSSLLCQGPVIAGQSVGGAAAPYTVVGAAGGLRALDFSIDLQGPKATVSTAAITATAFDPTSLNWWRNKIPSLRPVAQQGSIPNDGSPGALTLLSTTINGGGPTDLTVLQDGTSTALSLATYGYELLPQSAPMAWMTASGGGALQVLEAIITAHFSYTKVKPIGSGTLNIGAANDHVHHVRVKLCNSASTSQSFTQYTSTGESLPPNLAQSVYNALAPLQYSFSHTLVEKPFNGWLKPGLHGIHLGGPEAAPAWTTMNATLQQSEYKMHLDGGGSTFDNFTIKCGPVEHLEPGELIQLFNVFGNRDLAKIDTNERLTGTPAPGNTVAAPSDTAQENSVPGTPDQGLQAFTAVDPTNTGCTNAILHAPATGQIQVQQISSATAANITTGIIAPTYSGPGAPAAATLATSAYYRVRDRYLNTTANQEYVCTTAGDKGASIWALLSGPGVNWQTPKKELDPTAAVAQGTRVYLSPGNALVNAGMLDYVSGDHTSSSPGIWEAAQAVPAQTTTPPAGMPAGTYYHVPQLPYPGATGTPSGTPLSGDADGTNVFWLKLADAPLCF